LPEIITLADEEKRKLDELHLRKIDISNSIYVIDVEGYIGDSTRIEIGYTKEKFAKLSNFSKRTLKEAKSYSFKGYKFCDSIYSKFSKEKGKKIYYYSRDFGVK